MEGNTTTRPWVRRGTALLLAALLIFAALPAGRALAESEITKKTQAEAPKVTMELYPYGDNSCKLTVFGTGELLRYYRANVPNYQCQFRYKLHFDAERAYDLTGRIRFYHYEGKTEESIQWISSKLTCKNIAYDVKRANTDDPEKISWIIEFPEWLHFDGGKNLKTVEFTLYNAYETRQKVTQSFNMADIVTDTLVTAPLKSGGTLRVVAPDGKKDRLDIYLTDPDLAAGYTISKTPGQLTPKWKITVGHGSYNWFYLEADGTQSKSLDDMQLAAGMFQLDEKGTNKYRSGPVDVSGCSYELEGDTLVFHYISPETFRIHLNEMVWVQVDLHGGQATGKYKLR